MYIPEKVWLALDFFFPSETQCISLAGENDVYNISGQLVINDEYLLWYVRILYHLFSFLFSLDLIYPFGCPIYGSFET